MENRTFERITSHVHVKIYHDNAVYFGTIRDFSESGMFISTKMMCCPINTQFDVTIPFKDKIVVIPVKVRRLGTTDGIFDGIGVELLYFPKIYPELLSKLRYKAELRVKSHESQKIINNDHYQ